MLARAVFSLGLYVLSCACATRGMPAGDATAATRQYVIEHRPELQRDIQRGTGESLYDLSIVADCQDLWQLGRTLRKKQSEIFPVPQASDTDVADRIVTLLREDSQLVCRDLELGHQRPFSAGRHRVWSPAKRS